jgi:hypothetical protein
MRSSADRSDPHAPRTGVYFEFTSVGGSIKVAAIDAATGTEVSVIGPARAARSDLQRLALQKLQTRLKGSPKP